VRGTTFCKDCHWQSVFVERKKQAEVKVEEDMRLTADSSAESRSFSGRPLATPTFLLRAGS